MAVVAGEFGGDAAAKFAVLGGSDRALRAIAVDDAATVGVHAQRLGIFLRQPCGRAGGGCSDDDGNMMLRGERDRAVEPIEIEMALRRLQAAPRKFSDTNNVEMRRFHHAQIGVPV